MFSRVARTSFRTVYQTQQKRNFQLPPAIKEKVPIYGAIVGTMALMFQVSVLYPWHEELSVQFDAVEKMVDQVKGLTKEHEEKMNTMIDLEQQVKSKERKILDREEEILATELKVLEQINVLVKKLEEQPVVATSDASSHHHKK